MSSDNILVSIKGVDKIFHRGDEVVHALRSINLDIIQGEYLSIMGPSGSGKSTLFNVIGALDKPSAAFPCRNFPRWNCRISAASTSATFSRATT